MTKIKRKSAEIERAVAHIIANKGITYRMAANQFGVGIQQVRGSILYRYGSLEAARKANTPRKPHGHRVAVPKWRRPCMSCGSVKPRPYPKYICGQCARKTNEIHDGII